MLASDKIVNVVNKFLHVKPTKGKTMGPYLVHIFQYLQIMGLQSLEEYQASTINKILHYEERIARNELTRTRWKLRTVEDPYQ